MHNRYTGKPGEATQSFQRALAIFQKLADDNPAVTAFRNRLAVIHNNVAGMMADTGKTEEALASFQRDLRSTTG